MNLVAVALELAAIVLSPLGCRLLNHRPHVWQFHATPPDRICTRCWRPLPKETT